MFGVGYWQGILCQDAVASFHVLVLPVLAHHKLIKSRNSSPSDPGVRSPKGTL